MGLPTDTILRATTPIALGAAVLAFASASFAEDRGADKLEEPVSGVAPSRAVELTTRSGYSQAFGGVSKDGLKFSDVAKNGTALEIGLGYRITPTWLLAGYVEGGLYFPAEGSLSERRSFSAATGVAAHFHSRPFSRLDPWVGFGTGVRGYWAVDDEQGTHTLYGVDAARLQLGLDYRIKASWIISPTLGASMTVFLSERAATDQSFHGVSDPRASVFFFAGVASRFDFGGIRVRQSYTSEVAER